MASVAFLSLSLVNFRLRARSSRRLRRFLIISHCSENPAPEVGGRHFDFVEESPRDRRGLA